MQMAMTQGDPPLARGVPRQSIGLFSGGVAGPGTTAGTVIWGLLSTASAVASTYHGYKRNQSVGWAIVWGLLGGMFPVITPTIAVAQGFGKKR
jgi:hypothetical protein